MLDSLLVWGSGCGLLAITVCVTAFIVGQMAAIGTYNCMQATLKSKDD